MRITLVVTSLAMTGVILVVSLVITTSSPLLIGGLVGLILGTLLLLRTDHVISLILVGGLFVNGIVTLVVPSLNKAWWLLTALGLLLLFASGLQALIRRNPGLSLPAFVKTAVFFLLFSLLVTVSNLPGIFEASAGFKRYFQLWGMMFTLAVFVYSPETYTRWLKLLLAIGLCQLPMALYERIILVPKRIGLGAGTVPIDVVSGTFEASFEGGGQNSTMAVFLILILAFLFVAWRERAFSRGWLTFCVIVVLIPLGLGETKIVIVLLPLMLGLASYPYFKAAPVKTSMTFVAGFALAVALGLIYFGYSGKRTDPISTKIEKTLAYNFGDVGYSDRFGLNRTSVLSFWWKENSRNNPIQLVFGHGVGASYSGAGALVPGHLARRYPYININLTTASSLLWDVGILGFALFILIFCQAGKAALQLRRRAMQPIDRAIAAMLTVAVASFAVMIFYSNAMIASPSFGVMMAFSLGYLAVLAQSRTAVAGLQTSPKFLADHSPSQLA